MSSSYKPKSRRQCLRKTGNCVSEQQVKHTMPNTSKQQASNSGGTSKMCEKEKWKLYSQRYRDRKKGNPHLVAQEKIKDMNDT